MKTAMELALARIELTIRFNYDDIHWRMFKNDCMEKEKEQIKDAWDAGMSEGIGTMMADLDWDGEFVNYYKETYGE